MFFPDNPEQDKKEQIQLNKLKRMKSLEDKESVITIRDANEEIMKEVKVVLDKKIQKQVALIRKLHPVDIYFLKTLLPKNPLRTGKLEINGEAEIPKTENLYFDKYNLDLKGMDIKFKKDLLVTRNPFSSGPLTKEKGNSFVKTRIENQISEDILWKLTNVNCIGKMLNKIESKIKKKLDLPLRDGGLRVNEKDFFKQMIFDKAYLDNFKQRGDKNLEIKVIGKKFQEKFHYVKDSINVKRAGEFVDYIKEKQQSRNLSN